MAFRYGYGKKKADLEVLNRGSHRFVSISDLAILRLRSTCISLEQKGKYQTDNKEDLNTFVPIVLMCYQQSRSGRESVDAIGLEMYRRCHRPKCFHRSKRVGHTILTHNLIQDEIL